MRPTTLAIAALLSCAACKKRAEPPPPVAPAADAGATATPAAPPPADDDPHSQARPDRAVVTHLALDLTVDFAARRLHGTAAYTFTRQVAGAELVLDTEQLEIEGVRACGDGGAAVPFTVEPPVPIAGRALVVRAPDTVTCVAIAYRTAADSGALLWVEPAGTLGGKQPMLFTHSQPIDGRRWLPSQDSPGIRFTYEATVRVPPGLLALMSAENPQTAAPDGVHRFAMKQPIPSYLVALAVGDFAFRPIGARTGVYAEAALVEAAASEFVEVDAMIDAAEALYGPYRWGRYDILVLPPSFPMGGMENPRLTFLTPTVITGDRTMVSLIAHELAHSWSGNLVTNATWNSLWLNEGVTTYVERRIMERLRGKELADLLWHIGRQDLDAEVARFGATSPRTHLAQRIGADGNPEDTSNEIAYEKGAHFLRTLEQRLGRDRFDAFLQARFERLAFKTGDTAAFIADARATFGADVEPLLARWIDAPGVPDDAAPATSARADAIAASARAFATTGALPDTTGWKTLEWVAFLRAVPAGVPVDRLRKLDGKHQLTASKNGLVLSYWLPIVIARDERTAVPAIDRFLGTVGRRLLVRPVYKAMVEQPDPFWREHARALFAEVGGRYHPLTRGSIAEILAEKPAPVAP